MQSWRHSRDLLGADFVFNLGAPGCTTANSPLVEPGIEAFRLEDRIAEPRRKVEEQDGPRMHYQLWMRYRRRDGIISATQLLSSFKD